MACNLIYFSRRLYHKIGIIGVPFNKGQPKEGVELGPVALRRAGLIEDLKKLHSQIDVKDYGDLNYECSDSFQDDKIKNLCEVSACNQKLSDSIATVLKEKRICITIGGDHCIALGSVDGHTKVCDTGKLALIWIDAHADINTYKSTPTGNFHGMPVSRLVKELADQWPDFPQLKWQKPRLTLNDLAYIGLRSVDTYEKIVLEKHAVTAFGMKEIQQHGIMNVVNKVLRSIDPKSNRKLHVSFDIDSLDMFEAPSTGTPVKGGLTLQEGIELMEAIASTGRLEALDIVEVNPRLGTLKDVQITLDAAKQIILAAFKRNLIEEKL